MLKSGSWGTLSGLITLAAGVILVLFVFFEDRPDERAKPRIVQNEIAAKPIPLELPKPEFSDEAAVATVTLPPPPAPPAPKALPVAEPAVKPMIPVPAPQPEPAASVKPLKPIEKPQPKPVEAKPKVLKPLEKKAKAAPRPIEVKPRKPLEAAKAPVKPAAVKPPKRLEPLHPSPRKLEEVKRPEPEPTPVQPETVHVSVKSTGSIAKEGRALLRLLEHGSGPTIEIAWPTGGSQRRSLYRALSGCFGMQAILMDGAGNLFSAKGQRGQKWEINLDRYSGFVRQPAGWVAPEERARADAIRSYHGFGWQKNVVRVFPRQVDSVLLGGLQQILGADYRQVRHIRASYRQEGGILFVDGIEADGMKVEGRIAFNPKRGGCKV